MDSGWVVVDNFLLMIMFFYFSRFILHAKRTGFVVEHDFIMATYLADRVIVFEGTPSSDATAHAPQSLLNGMNKFLELLGITFRRDPNNFRPRINKHSSVKVRCFLNFPLLYINNISQIHMWFTTLKVICFHETITQIKNLLTKDFYLDNVM